MGNCPGVECGLVVTYQQHVEARPANNTMGSSKPLMAGKETELRLRSMSLRPAWAIEFVEERNGRDVEGGWVGK